jgi:hypothetical protein
MAQHEIEGLGPLLAREVCADFLVHVELGGFRPSLELNGKR